jgi:uncharacterized protein (DUF58 family)
VKLPTAAGLLLLALLLRSPVLGVVAVLLLAVLLLARVWLRGIERDLRAQHRAPTTLPFNAEATLTVEVENHSLLPVPWLEVRERVPLALRTVVAPRAVVTLGAGATYSFSYVLKAQRRGWYSIGPLQLALGDVMGIATRRLQIPAISVTVFPKVVPLAELGIPAQFSLGPLRGQRGEDPARPAGVRTYAPGDDVRRLDWKASARQSTLLLRRADPSIAPTTTIALAFSAQDYGMRVLGDAIERAATAAASLGVALLGYKLPVGLVANGRDPQFGVQGVVLRPAKGDGQRQLLLQLLGRMEIGDGSNIWTLLNEQPLPWGGTTVLVLGDLLADHLSAITALRRRGQQVVLVLVDATARGRVLAQQQHLTMYSVDRQGMPVAVSRGK